MELTGDEHRLPERTAEAEHEVADPKEPEPSS